MSLRLGLMGCLQGGLSASGIALIFTCKDKTASFTCSSASASVHS